MTKDKLAATVAVNIRRYRKARDLSVSALAERAEIGNDYLGHLERGAKTPSLEMLARIASGLGVGPEDLVRQRVKPETPSSVTRRLQSFLRGLNETQKADVLAVLIKLRRADRVHALRVALGA